MFKSDLNHVNSTPTVSEAVNKCQLQVLSLASMDLNAMVQLAVALPEAVSCSAAFCCSICWKAASSGSPPCSLGIDCRVCSMSYSNLLRTTISEK